MLIPSSPLRWSRLLKAATMILLGLAMRGASLHGQIYQYHYGNPLCRDAGRSVVKIPTPAGGNLTVGESFSGAGCANSDIYAVCTNPDGSLNWSNTYNFQGIDSATDVVACVNGDFVITGSTTGSSGSRDLFLLRISPLGAMIASYVFGDPRVDDYGMDVIETSFGNGTFTNPGDIVVVGWRGPVGQRDPFILRTKANLTFVWDDLYLGFWAGDSIRKGDEYFMAVEELRTGVGANAGDLVAVGGADSYGAGMHDVFLARFDQFGGPLGTKVIGGALDDEAQSVMEVRGGVNLGDIAIAGSTRSRPGSFTPNLDCYVLQTSPAFGIVRGDVIFGHPMLDDEAFSISHDLLYSADRDAMIVTGYTNAEWGTLTGENVFLQRIAGGGGALLGLGKIYGGDGNDRGYDVARPVPFNVINPPETPGYVVSGYTRSPNLILGDPEQLYLIKADTFLSSGCNEADVLFGPVNPPWPLVSVDPIGVGTWGDLASLVTQGPQTWERVICTDQGGNRTVDGDGEEGVAGMEPRSPRLDPASAFSFPNPLRQGDHLNLRFDLAAPSSTTITVTDMLGNIITRYEGEYEAGPILTTFPTESWPQGTYLVRIVAGEMIKECKVVIGR